MFFSFVYYRCLQKSLFVTECRNGNWLTPINIKDYSKGKRGLGRSIGHFNCDTNRISSSINSDNIRDFCTDLSKSNLNFKSVYWKYLCRLHKYRRRK